jgi:DNA-binding NarL/FixJ family response regulator
VRVIRVLLADQALLRQALAEILDREDDIAVVAQVGRGDEVLAAALCARPDVALVDIEMPGRDGLVCAADLREHLPSCRVLVLTVFNRPGYLRRALENGAAGYVLKDAAPRELVDAIRVAAAGGRVLDPEHVAAVPGRPARRPPAGTVKAVLEQPAVLEAAVAAGLRSLFVGFETVNAGNLSQQRKYQNIGRDYDAAVRRLHDLGVMVNGSFVFGMDHDGPDVFDRTVEWAIAQGVETATFHILTPYPGTALYERMAADGRILHRDWDRYDTRHVVFRPARLDGASLEAGYWRAYCEFYRWPAIWRGAATKDGLTGRLRHLAYAGGWKKFEPLWDVLIRSGRVLHALPALEAILSGFGSHRPTRALARPAAR